MAGLKTYHAKRDFGVTAEPRGEGFAPGRPGLRHPETRRDAAALRSSARTRWRDEELGGDARTEPVPGEKRLAVQVEDHPIEYNNFEGTIPKGEYGGGTVMIWDRGSWKPEGDPHPAQEGPSRLLARRREAAGGWHLVRMRSRPGEKNDNWLLIKAARRGRALARRPGYSGGDAALGGQRPAQSRKSRRQRQEARLAFEPQRRRDVKAGATA